MLTSRERVRRLLNFQPVDRIPNGLGGCETAGLHVLAYNKLKRLLGANDEKTRIDTFMANAIMEPSVLERIKGDIILLGSPRMCSARFWGEAAEAEWREQELWGGKFYVPKNEKFTTCSDGTIWWIKNETSHLKCPPGGIFFDLLPKQYENKQEKKITPDDYTPSHDIPDDKLRILEESARQLYENTDYSIACGETIEDLQLQPGGITEWWMLMLDEPQTAHEFLSNLYILSAKSKSYGSPEFSHMLGYASMQNIN